MIVDFKSTPNQTPRLIVEGILVYKNRTPALFFTLEFLFYSNFKLANNYYVSNLSDGRLFGTKNGNRPSKLKDYSEIGKDKDRGTKLNLKDYKFEISKCEFEEIFNILSCSNVFPQELCYTILSFLCDYSRINFYFKYVPKNRKEIKIFFREQASKKYVSTKEIKIPIVF